MSILIKLRENKGFSNNEKIVAKYLIKNYRNIKNIDGRKIAKETFTSLSSVTRMCKRLGFKGFNELKLLLIEEVSVLENEKLSFENSDVEKNYSTKMIIEKLNKLSMEALKETKLLQDTEMIDKVVNLINKKSIIDFYGIGASHIVCLDAEYKFMRVGKLTNAYKSFDQQYIQALNSGKENLAIIVSYSGMTKEMVEIADILKAKDIDTVSITRYSDNKVAKRCKYNIYVTSKEALKRSAAIYSRMSMLNVIDVIYFKYFNVNYDEAFDKIVKTKIKK